MNSAMREAIQAGDIARDAFPAVLDDNVNLYQGSGRMGCSFDAFGLMGWRSPEGFAAQGIAKTHIMHSGHWHRGLHGLDYWLPIGRLLWSEKPKEPKAYSQKLELCEGRLSTSLHYEGLSISLSSSFNPFMRDIFAVEIRHSAQDGAKLPTLELQPLIDLVTHYSQHLTGKAEKLSSPLSWTSRVRVGTADSVLALRVIGEAGEAKLEDCGEGVRIELSGRQGKQLLLVGVSAYGKREELFKQMLSIASPDAYFSDAAQAWRKRYGDAFIKTPSKEQQALWARSLYYVLCSYTPDVEAPAGPMGWSGAGWPFHFPQDLSYIHPALLRLGHYDIAKAWVEFYNSRIKDTQKLTKTVYKAEGACWAWEHPIGPDSEALSKSSPNHYQYEIHNAAYPARMAHETAAHIKDAEWEKSVAWPVIRESARFLGSVAKKDTDGLWSIHVTPSMGQDELGGQDAKNYLCALFSAKYTLGIAVETAERLGLDDKALPKWRQILADGLAFAHLLVPESGIYKTNELVDASKVLARVQKHPIQLCPLSFLPSGTLSEEDKRAYEKRYEICNGTDKKFYHGWTLAAYWLASSHMGDAEGLQKSLSESLPGRYVDADNIQIYESSGIVGAPFYVTSHGFLLQALNDAFASDYFGELEVGKACPESWQEASFENLRIAGGTRVSGSKENGSWRTATR